MRFRTNSSLALGNIRLLLGWSKAKVIIPHRFLIKDHLLLICYRNFSVREFYVAVPNKPLTLIEFGDCFIVRSNFPIIFLFILFTIPSLFFINSEYREKIEKKFPVQILNFKFQTHLVWNKYSCNHSFLEVPNCKLVYLGKWLHR